MEVIKIQKYLESLFNGSKVFSYSFSAEKKFVHFFIQFSDLDFSLTKNQIEDLDYFIFQQNLKYFFTIQVNEGVLLLIITLSDKL